MAPGWAATLSFLIVTVCITFVSLVLGELAPKRIGLQRAPRLALLAAPLLDRIASLARPVVWLLTGRPTWSSPSWAAIPASAARP